MTITKRIAAIMLSLVCLAAVLPNMPMNGAAVAADSADSNTVRFLEALDIMSTDSYTESFWDERPVKRNEIAEIICRIFAYEATKDEVPRFNDVAEDDRAYVETAARNGYLSGNGDGTFSPNNHVTNQQLVKIFVTILGGAPMAEGMGGYPQGYISAARKLGIGKNLSMGDSVESRRIDVGSMIYDTMHADMPEIREISGTSASYTTKTGETFLSETLDIYKYEGTIDSNAATGLKRPNGSGDGYVTVDGTIFGDPNGILDEMLGEKVTVYVKSPDKDNGVVIFVEKDNDKTFSIKGEDFINADKRSVTYYADNKQKTITISITSNMIYNGKAIDFDITKVNSDSDVIRFTDSDGDGVYDLIVVTKYDTYVINSVLADSEKIMLKYGETALDLKDGIYRITIDGAQTDISELKANDVLSVAQSSVGGEKWFDIKVSRNSISGRVDSIRTDSADGRTYVTIGGTEYKVSEYFDKLVKANKLIKISAGDSGRYYTDVMGEIVFDRANANSEKVGYLMRGSITDDAFSKVIILTVFTEDRAVAEYRITDKFSLNDQNTDPDTVAKSAGLSDKFKTAQLIKYTVDNGTIKRIWFAKDSYDPNEFSKDVDENTIRCTNELVLGDKYSLTDSTKVFIVPDAYSDTTTKYNVSTGSYFRRDIFYYNVALYDIGTNSEIAYAVITRTKTSSEIGEGSPLLAVSAVAESLDDNGDTGYSLVGINESGNAVTIPILDEALNTEVKPGYVVQYNLSYANKIDEINVVCANDEKYSLIRSGSTNFVYGQVCRTESGRIMLKCGDIVPDMSPLDISKVISATGTLNLRFNKDKNSFDKIKFDEIVYGEKVFACINVMNNNRMLVVYE